MDVVVDVVPIATKPILEAIEVAKIGATIVLGGVKGKNSNVSLDSDKILFKELNIKGVYSQGYKAYEESLRILEESKFDFSKMKTHEFSLTNAEKAINTLYEEESEEANSEFLVMGEDDMKQAKGLESTIKIDCEKCHNQEGVWWTFQTRSADEPETKFYRCTKCNHTWRDYT